MITKEQLGIGGHCTLYAKHHYNRSENNVEDLCRINESYCGLEVGFGYEA